MKKKILVACITLVLLVGGWASALSAYAQAPSWQLASAPVGATAASKSIIYGAVSDAAGNVYVAGNFSGTVSFGATTLTSSSMEPGPSASSLFVAKWNRLTGAFVWAVQAGGAADCAARAVAVSGNSIYLAGYFRGATAVFGTTTLLNRESSTADGFLLKLTDLGTSATFNAGWVQQLGGVGDDGARTIALDGSDVYVAGKFSSPTVNFGSTTLSNAGNADGFVTKITDAGATSSFGWALRIGSVDNDGVFGMQASGGNLYLSGEFSNTVNFGSTTLTSAGNLDGFVAKVTGIGSAPSFIWSLRVGGVGLEELFQLAVDGSNVYVCGVSGSARLTIGTTTFTNAGIFDALLVKLIDAGSTSTIAWAQQMGGSGIDEAFGLAARGGKVYVGGGFGFTSAGNLISTAVFGPTTVATVGGGDVFLSRLTDAGTTATFDWTRTAGSKRDDELQALAVSGGSVYAAGFFNGESIAFDNTTLLNKNTGIGSTAGFVAVAADPVLADDPVLPTRELATLAGTALYPNPAHTVTTVRVPAGTGVAALTLLDALGRTISTQTAVPGTNYPLYLAGLAPGVYALRVQLADGQATHKLIIE